MKPSRILTLLIIIAILIGAGTYIVISKSNIKNITSSLAGPVDSFVECVADGYPVMESDPRKCSSGGKTFTEVSLMEVNKQSDLIKIAQPETFELFKSPQAVRGAARGQWYFEGTFPVTLLDANGKVIAETYAEAEADWMTENFVLFSANVTFDTPVTSTGTLILKKSNASGLPENDAEISMEVRFK